MEVRKDFDIKDNDLVFENGDFATAESDQQHIADTINAYPSWWKQYPTDGVGIMLYQNSSLGLQKLSRKLKIELEKDGYKVNNPVIEFAPNGQLNIYPNATI